jgi:hypothetical protein
MTDTENAEYERRNRELELTTEAEGVVDGFSRFVNRHGRSDNGKIVDAMSREHRTLQQGMTGAMLQWFKHLSELPEHGYDARNEHSVKIAKKIRKLLEDEYGSAWTHMPYI